MKTYKYVITVDLGYGDSGKGSICDYLSKSLNSKLVVRYNGGAQAFHTVYNNGRKHIFRQFGSGTLNGANTVIGPQVIVNPLTMSREAGELQLLGIPNALKLVTVSEDALIVTPFHRALNIIREHTRISRHGSTGMGIGEARRFNLDNPVLALRVKDTRSARDALAERLNLLRTCLSLEAQALTRNKNFTASHFLELDEQFRTLGADWQISGRLRALADSYIEWANSVHIETTYTIKHVIRDQDKPVIFEGAQGVLLDQKFGFHPYTTWSDTTPKHALELISEQDQTSIIGITRTCLTRHGAGPLVSEGRVGCGLIADDDNEQGEYQGGLRVGALDAVSLAYAIGACELNGAPIDSLAVTHCDKLEHATIWPVCLGYEGLSFSLNCYYLTNEAGPEAEKFTSELFNAKPRIVEAKPYKVLDELSNDLQVPIAIKSYGKSAEHKLKLL